MITSGEEGMMSGEDPSDKIKTKGKAGVHDSS